MTVESLDIHKLQSEVLVLILLYILGVRYGETWIVSSLDRIMQLFVDHHIIVQDLQKLSGDKHMFYVA